MLARLHSRVVACRCWGVQGIVLELRILQGVDLLQHQDVNLLPVVVRRGLVPCVTSRSSSTREGLGGFLQIRVLVDRVGLLGDGLAASVARDVAGECLAAALLRDGSGNGSLLPLLPAALPAPCCLAA